jgi:hypothetical protein
MRTKLSLFNGFSLDMASDFTGLRPGELNWLRQQGIVQPTKVGSAFMYTFTDLLVLRLVRQLKRVNVKVKSIKKAKNYLNSLDPSQSLTNVALYIGENSGKIYYIGESPQQDVLVDLTQGGQLVRSDFVVVLRVGRELESMRKEVLGLDTTVSQRLKAPRLIPLEEGLKKYGLG